MIKHYTNRRILLYLYVTKVATLSPVSLRQTVASLMVISYIAPQAVVYKPPLCDAISTYWHNISLKSERMFLLLPHNSAYWVILYAHNSPIPVEYAVSS